MSYGIKIFGANGNPVFSSATDTVLMYIGNYSTGTNNGSITIPGASNITLVAPNAWGWTFTVSGNTVSWSWSNYSWLEKAARNFDVYGSLSSQTATQGIKIVGADGTLALSSEKAGLYVVRNGTAVAKPLSSMPYETYQTPVFSTFRPGPPTAPRDSFITLRQPGEKHMATHCLSDYIITGEGIYDGKSAWFAAATGPTAVTFEYFMLSPIPATQTDAYGLVLKDASGTVIFNSGSPPIRVKGVKYVPSNSPAFFSNGAIASTTGTTGKYATVMLDELGEYSWEYMHTHLHDFTSKRGVAKSTPTGALTNTANISFVTGAGLGGSQTVPNGFCSAILLDVTGY